MVGHAMKSKLTGSQWLLAIFSDNFPLARVSYSSQSIEQLPDPFELPYLKKPVARIMPYYPDKTLFVYRAREVYTNAEDKARLRKQKEAGISERDDIMGIFRVQLDDEFDYNVPLALPEEATFQEAAQAMSTGASSMLANRLVCATKKHSHMNDGDLALDLFDTKFSVAIDGDQGRSLRQTLLEDDSVTLEILANGKEKRRIPYAIRWLQYPLESVSVPFCPREGFPVAALVEPKKGAKLSLFPEEQAEVASYPHGLRYFWFTMEDAKGSKRVTNKELIEWIETDDGWRPHLRDAQFVCEAAAFTPAAEHVGKYLAVAASCLPAARLSGCSSSTPFTDPAWTVAGKSTEVVVAKSVGEELLAAPKMEWAAGDERTRAEDPDKSRLRVISYNLLADQYINLAKPPAELYYPYVDKKYQHMRYRYSLILKELEAYAADVYILQEVCQRMSTQYLPALFKARNYGSAFHRKYVEVREGSGLLWSRARFEERCGGSRCRWLTDVLADDHNKDIRALLARAAPEDRKFFEDRPTLVHIVELDDRVSDGGTLLVGNTHLHHDPRHEHYKVLQTALVVRELAQRVRAAREARPEAEVRVLLGADLNSTPDAAAVTLLSKGRVAVDDPVWAADVLMGGMELRLPDELIGLRNLSGEPAFTNYTRHQMKNKDGVSETKGFAGCIDYLFACGLQTVAMAEQPTIDQIKQHTALPSPIAPSDHLALVLSARYSS